MCSNEARRTHGLFIEPLLLSTRITTVEGRAGQGKAGQQISNHIEFINVALLSLSKTHSLYHKYETHFVAQASLKVLNSTFNNFSCNMRYLAQ